MSLFRNRIFKSYKFLDENTRELSEIITNGEFAIDTNYIPNSNTKIEIKFQPVYHTYGSVPGNGIVCGCRTSDTSNNTSITCNSANHQLNLRLGNNILATGGNDSWKIGEVYTVIMSKSYCSINGKSLKISSTAGTQYANLPMYIGTINQNGTAQKENGFCNIFYCKIWDNDILIRDYVCAINKDGTKKGMWDYIENKFYKNIIGT